MSPENNSTCCVRGSVSNNNEKNLRIKKNYFSSLLDRLDPPYQRSNNEQIKVIVKTIELFHLRLED